MSTTPLGESADPARSAKPSRPVMTVPRFRAAKGAARPLTVLTAYDFLWAGLLDQAGADALLVGDSLAMVVQGKRTTLPVTMDEIIYHAEMVVRATRSALVVVDLPFLSFQVSPEDAIRNAGRILKETGASAVKLEGGVRQAQTIRALVDADIPVMAHVGLRPQSVHRLGGYRVQRDGEQLLKDAVAAEEAGAFAMVVECVPGKLGGEITRRVSIPTIGIGAGPECDGQVLVTQDMLGLSESPRPKFVKAFVDLRAIVTEAVGRFREEVGERTYPGPAHTHE
jgi:3-methyl-2-oxobutanoate hydroxymethyltransferase